MALKDRVRGLAHKLPEARSEGERLRPVEERSRRMLLEFKREAVQRALSLVVEGVLGPGWQRRESRKPFPWVCAVVVVHGVSPRCGASVHCRRIRTTNLL
jgi:hypothetical protein